MGQLNMAGDVLNISRRPHVISRKPVAAYPQIRHSGLTILKILKMNPAAR